MSGLSKCRDPEHYFYGLSGNWEWSLRTADYWRSIGLFCIGRSEFGFHLDDELNRDG